MATLLHQAALPTAKPQPWRLNSTASLFPLHVAVAPMSRRRQAPAAVLSAATDGASSISTDAAPPSKKKTRKEKQLDRSRQQDTLHRQRQLMMQASLPKADAGGGSGSGKQEYAGDDDELPQNVFDRILRRILIAVGLPMASGVALLNVYNVLKRDQGVEVPSWLPLLTILVAFGTSALGIAYGTLSASWDPEKEGSLLGIDEARANWPVLWAEEIEKEKAKARKKK